MPEKPRAKKRKQKSSIWEIVDDEQALERKVSAQIFTPMRELGLDGWTHWPTPYNFQAEIKILACQDGTLAEIKLYAVGFAWWFWSNIVPSPVELTRKLLLGGYKCGFYLPVKFKSPLTVIVGEDGVSLLAKWARPFTTALFWWWVIGSAFSALATWESIQQAKHDCPDNTWEWHGVGHGGSFLGTGKVTTQIWTDVYDPDNHQVANTAGVSGVKKGTVLGVGVEVQLNGMTGGTWWLTIEDGLGNVYKSTTPYDRFKPNQANILTYEAEDVGSGELVAYFNTLNVTASGGLPTWSMPAAGASGPI